MSITYQNILLTAADLGPVNPLPQLSAGGDMHAHIPLGPSVSPEEGKYMGWGQVHGIAPYPLQDGYDRDRRPREFPAAILENRYLRAVFLPTLGGRLWQLWDKKRERELVYHNPILQMGNLGLRNAWFAGGVEFNIGMTGHTPFTCDRLFTAHWQTAEGTDVLRMYEFERIRQVTFCIDAFLPEDSPFLYLNVEIVNTRPCEVPIYWWSNIAVEETPDTRVIVPAAKAYHWDYRGVMEKQSVPVTESEGVDLSYSMNADHSLDLFFDIVPPQRPFIAALDGRGTGLVQCSTRRLLGRKLFMWGTGSGGDRWQEHLSGPGRRYLEIQAGLAHTQLECLPLPAGARWSWLEAYGALDCDPVLIHGEDYSRAAAEADRALEAALPMAALESLHERIKAASPRMLTPDRVGSGWAQLEEMRRGEPLDGRLSFTGSLGPEQQPWVQLLADGSFPDAEPTALPQGWQTQNDWEPLLAAAAPSAHGELHLGLLRYAAGDRDGARRHWLESARLAPSPWAWRNLGRLALLEKEPAAAEYYKRALELAPGERHLALEALDALIGLGETESALNALDKLPGELAALGRMQLLRVRALLGLGRARQALAILQDPSLTVADYQEGEGSLTELWQQAAAAVTGLEPEAALEKLPLPAHLDYRMRI